jgi:hypothetical protein
MTMQTEDPTRVRVQTCERCRGLRHGIAEERGQQLSPWVMLCCGHEVFSIRPSPAVGLAYTCELHAEYVEHD